MLIPPWSNCCTECLLHLSEVLMMLHIVSTRAIWIGIGGVLRRSWGAAEHFINHGQIVSLEKARVYFSHWREQAQKFVLVISSSLMRHLLFLYDLFKFFLWGILLIWWGWHFSSGLLSNDGSAYDLSCQCGDGDLCRSNCSSKSTE